MRVEAGYDEKLVPHKAIQLRFVPESETEAFELGQLYESYHPAGVCIVIDNTSPCLVVPFDRLWGWLQQIREVS